MAENNLDELFLAVCALNDALKFTVRYGTDDATAFEKQQLADKKVSLLVEKWEWNKSMNDEQKVDSPHEMGEVAKDLITLARAVKENGMLSELSEISITYRVGELWKTVTLTFNQPDPDDPHSTSTTTVEEGDDTE